MARNPFYVFRALPRTWIYPREFSIAVGRCADAPYHKCIFHDTSLEIVSKMQPFVPSGTSVQDMLSPPSCFVSCCGPARFGEPLPIVRHAETGILRSEEMQRESRHEFEARVGLALLQCPSSREQNSRTEQERSGAREIEI